MPNLTWEAETPTYFDTKQFLSYVEAVRKVITKPMTIREIHKALRTKARREWTMDALERLSTVVGCEEKLVSRYFPRQFEITMPKQSKQVYHNNSSKAIFYREPTKAILPTAGLMGELRN